MTSQDFEQDAVSAYGAARKAAWRAHLEASAAASTAASMEAHRADHDVVTAGQRGLFGHTTPQQMAATVAARRRVGDGAGAGRDLETWGGVDFEAHGAGAVAPIPPRADLRFVNQPGGQQPSGESPLARYMRGRD